MTLLGKLIVFALAASVTAVPFFYYTLASSDDGYSDALKKLKAVLSKEGLIDPEGITVDELQRKNEIYRVSFKAHFYTKDGKECNYKWREVLYSATFIAHHECTAAPVVLPPVVRHTTTTTEDPTTTTSETSGSGSDESKSTAAPTTTTAAPTTTPTADSPTDETYVASEAKGGKLSAQRSAPIINRRRSQRRYHF